MINEYIKELNEIYKKGKIKEVYTSEEKLKQANRTIPKRRIFTEISYNELKIEMQKLTEDYLGKLLPSEDLEIEYKPGLAFNISTNPWIIICNKDNSKAPSYKSIYMGVDFKLKVFGEEENSIKIWIGRGLSNTTIEERISNRTELVNKLKNVLGDKLDSNFEYVPIEDKYDYGLAIRTKKGWNTDNFENCFKYLSKKYLEFIEVHEKENNNIDKNLLIQGIDPLDLVYKNYLNHIDNKYCSLITHKPDYRLFLYDLGMVIKDATTKKSKDFYLIIKDIDKYPEDYLNELLVLLNRDNKGETKYPLNNSYLSEIIFKESDKKISIPKNLTVIATSKKEISKELKELFNLREK